jgi:hypothetical protein
MPTGPEKREFMRKNLLKDKGKDPRLVDLLTECMAEAEAEGYTGKIKYIGTFSSANNTASSILEINTDALLNLIDGGLAERVLNCIGNSDRLKFLRALLKQPMSVSRMIETVGYNSTGQAYHHLKALQAAALVEEDKNQRGIYRVAPHRVNGIILILAGIYDLTDEEYTKGNWTEAPEEE